jgi:hypothetical protein
MSQISLHAARNILKQHINRCFPALVDLKIAKNAIFYLKVLDKIYSQDIFLRMT